jgi:hypothetical protein
MHSTILKEEREEKNNAKEEAIDVQSIFLLPISIAKVIV